LILRERYGLRFEQAPPPWAQAYKLPAQVRIETKIGGIQEEVQSLTRELMATREQLEETTRFRRLLYEQGEDGLEPVVRDALRELGAQVTDPGERGREDGRLVDPSGRNGMLEIKGKTKALGIRDVRQLDQWVRDAMAEEEWEGKGLLIANTYCGDPLEQRGEPFPQKSSRSAKRFGQCLLTTTQLFCALCSHQRGELDAEAFWDTIFETDGVCSLPELEPIDEEPSEQEETND
jgi:hypothetical protein